MLSAPHPMMWQYFEQRLRDLEESNARLKQKNEWLQQQLEKIKQQLEEVKPLHIENINYKIQELVVKELSGTLNIGLTGISDPQEFTRWLKKEDGEEREMQKEATQHELNLSDIETK